MDTSKIKNDDFVSVRPITSMVGIAYAMKYLYLKDDKKLTEWISNKYPNFNMYDYVHPELAKFADIVKEYKNETGQSVFQTK